MGYLTTNNGAVSESFGPIKAGQASTRLRRRGCDWNSVAIWIGGAVDIAGESPVVPEVGRRVKAEAGCIVNLGRGFWEAAAVQNAFQGIGIPCQPSQASTRDGVIWPSCIGDHRAVNHTELGGVVPIEAGLADTGSVVLWGPVSVVDGHAVNHTAQQSGVEGVPSNTGTVERSNERPIAIWHFRTVEVTGRIRKIPRERCNADTAAFDGRGVVGVVDQRTVHRAVDVGLVPAERGVADAAGPVVDGRRGVGEVQGRTVHVAGQVDRVPLELGVAGTVAAYFGTLVGVVHDQAVQAAVQVGHVPDVPQQAVAALLGGVVGVAAVYGEGYLRAVDRAGGIGAVPVEVLSAVASAILWIEGVVDNIGICDIDAAPEANLARAVPNKSGLASTVAIGVRA